MNQFATITHFNSLTVGGRKRAVKKQSAYFGRISFNSLLIFLICVLGVLYIFEVNDLATQGYKIQALEKQLQELSEDNEKLKFKEAELRSMYNIEEKTKDLNMVAPVDVSYISLPGNVAMNK